MENAFRGASNVSINATDTPNLSKVTSMVNMFNGATNLSGDLSKWDVSNVITMQDMFNGATNFTSDLSGWKVSNVTTMQGMFK
jgi:surface protein